MIERVVTDTFEMDYFCFGEGKQALAVIPGISIQSVMGLEEAVKKVYESFVGDFKIYVFDRRADMPDDYSVHDMACDTAEAMKKLGLKDVCIFGASQGGMIALEIAIMYPELVKKIAVGSTSANLKNDQNDVFDELIDLAKKKDAKALYLAFGEKAYPPKMFEQCKAAFEAAAETVTDEDLRRFIICSKGLKGFDITDRLKAIKCPALVTGEYRDEILDSDMTMEIAEQLEEQEGFELFMYNGFGHAAYDTAPDYGDRLYRFFMK